MTWDTIIRFRPFLNGALVKLLSMDGKKMYSYYISVKQVGYTYLRWT